MLAFLFALVRKVQAHIKIAHSAGPFLRKFCDKGGKVRMNTFPVIINFIVLYYTYKFGNMNNLLFFNIFYCQISTNTQIMQQIYTIQSKWVGLQVLKLSYNPPLK